MLPRAVIATLIDKITDVATGIVIFLLVMVVVLPVFWWCCRKYFQIIRKGYRPPFAQAALFIVGFAGFMTGVLAIIAVRPGGWLATVALIIGGFILGGLAAVAATELLALLLPHRRSRRSGAREAGFLASPAFHAVEVTVRVVVGGSVAVALSAFLWSSADEAFRLLRVAGSLVTAPALLVYWRRRATAPTIEQALADDLRAPVLHLRPFSQDAGVFSWVRSADLSRYSAAPRTSSLRTIFPVNMQQYLGSELSRRIGPMIALGNPVDYLPPEGAARRYLPDDGWQPYLLGAAESAGAIVMEFGPSDNLTWELEEIKKRGWHRKLFVITPPTPQPKRPIDRLVIKAYASARRVPTARWPDAVDQLSAAGFPMDDFCIPGPGAVVGFDEQARARSLADGQVEAAEFVDVVANRVGSSASAVLGHPPSCAEADRDDTTLLAAQPDRIAELWALAKKDGWSDRPLKSDLRPLATAVLPDEQLVGIVRVCITFSQTLTVLVTDRYLHISHDGTDERCRNQLAQFPVQFRARTNRVRVPRAQIIEPLRTDGGALVMGIAGHSPVRLTVHTAQPRYRLLGEWLR